MAETPKKDVKLYEIGECQLCGARANLEKLAAHPHKGIPVSQATATSGGVWWHSLSMSLTLHRCSEAQYGRVVPVGWQSVRFPFFVPLEENHRIVEIQHHSEESLRMGKLIAGGGAMGMAKPTKLRPGVV